MPESRPNATISITNLTITTLDTQYSQALQVGCRRLRIRCRTAAAIRIAFVTGKVAASTAPFLTIKSGEVWDSGDGFNGYGQTLYVGAGAGSLVAEIEEWLW